MRRALFDVPESERPAFSHIYGIRPWEIERLTAGEIHTYRTYLHRLNSEDE